MTQRKKISLPPPADPTAEAAPPRRRPPVRGAGTAPRKRPTAAEAAQAREEAQAEAARRAEEGADGAADGTDTRPPRPRPPRDDQPGRRGDGSQGRRDPRGSPRREGPDARRQDARHHDDRRPAPRRDAARSEPPRQEGGYRDGPRRDAPPRGRASEHRGAGDYRDSRGDRSADDARGRAAPRHPKNPSQAPSRRPRPQAASVGEASPAPGSLRLSKRLSELGLASRREADEWIVQGWVRVDGVVVNELGSRVTPDQQVTIDDAARREQAQRVTVLINKPVGFVSGQAEDGYDPAITLVTPDNHWSGDRSGIRYSPAQLRHLAPAGRLDIDSVGLLVLTQDGRVAKRLIGEDSPIEKEYLVRVRLARQADDDERHASELLPEDALELLRHGLSLDGEKLKPAKVSWQNEDQLRFVLREGKKRQIRRMCEAVGLKVVGLKRVRIGRVPLGDLPPGQWRYLRPDESF